MLAILLLAAPMALVLALAFFAMHRWGDDED
jgi:3D (Asp-Asp-Asp) domain-containing protein